MASAADTVIFSVNFLQDLQRVFFPFCIEASSFLGVNALLAGLVPRYGRKSSTV